MAIEIKFEDKSKRRITVNDLKSGDIFIYDGTPYMLLTNGGKYGYYYIDKDDDNCGRFDCDYYAVDLSEGILRDFEGLEEVSFITKDLEMKLNKEDIREWV